MDHPSTSTSAVDGHGVKRTGDNDRDDDDNPREKKKKKRPDTTNLRKQSTFMVNKKANARQKRRKVPYNVDVGSLRTRESTVMDFDLNRQETSVEMADLDLDVTDAGPVETAMRVQAERCNWRSGASVMLRSQDTFVGSWPLNLVKRQATGAGTLRSGLTHTLIGMDIKQEPSTVEMNSLQMESSMSVDNFNAQTSGVKRKMSRQASGKVTKKFKKSESTAKKSIINKEGKKNSKGKEKLKVQMKRKMKPEVKSESAPALNNNTDSELIIKCEPIDEEAESQFRSPLLDDTERKERRRERKTKPRTPGVCIRCNKVFSSASSLKRHNEAMHSADCKPLTCSFCDAIFTKEYKLKAHIRKAHNGDRAFPCSECHLVFTRDCHLKVHMRKHTNERPYKCDVEGCESTFRTTSNLNRHKHKHSGLRPYICTVCNADFYQASHLRSHIRKHTGERPFKCNKCDATFRQLTHLHRHRVKHTGVKPYICAECGVGFVEKCTWTRHVKLRHSEHAKFNAASLIANIKKKKKTGRKLRNARNGGERNV